MAEHLRSQIFEDSVPKAPPKAGGVAAKPPPFAPLWGFLQFSKLLGTVRDSKGQ